MQCVEAAVIYLDGVKVVFRFCLPFLENRQGFFSYKSVEDLQAIIYW